MALANKSVLLSSFTDVFSDKMVESQPMSLSPSIESQHQTINIETHHPAIHSRPQKHTGQYGEFRSVDEIDERYRSVFTYPFFNLVQSNVIEDALYSDKSMVVCAPTGSGKTVVFEMAIVQLLMELEDKNYTDDFKIIYMAPVKAICTERLTEWYPKFTQLGLLCIEVTGDTNVDFSQLKPYRIIITTPEKWDILTRRWTDYRGLVGVIRLFLIDEVHILNDESRGPVLETVVSRMKTIESSSQSAYRIEQLQKQYRGEEAEAGAGPPRIRFVAVSATVSNPEDVAAWLSSSEKTAVYRKFGDECRPVKIKRIVEGYPCGEAMSIFKFDFILNYKLWPIIQKYYDGKPTLIFCNTRKSVAMTAETLARELTINFNAEQKAKLNALASTIKNKKLQALVLSGVGCHHAGLLFEERVNIEIAFRQRDLPILITTTTLAMGVNLPAHLVIIKNTQQYVNGAYQEYSISTILQMVGRAGRPQFDTEATAVIMTRLQDKNRYQALVGGNEPLQSYLHKRLPESLNSEAALRTVTDVAQCVQWLRSTFLYVRAAKDPRRYLALPPIAAPQQISKKVEELCVKAMNGLATAGLITMDEASCIESTEAGRLMSVYYLDFETMKQIMKISGTETLEQLLWALCECHELSDMHLRMEERRCLNALNRNNAAAAIRFPMKGKITTRQMKLNCMIQAVLGCLPISDPSLNQESMKILRIAGRVCKCLVTYTTRSEFVVGQPQHYATVLNSIVLAKCIEAQLWENSPFVSKQLRGIGPTISNLLATAGKVSFMLLEEAHPRDLERIMNRNAPAGNVLRKQVSLLPKYALAMNPIDERTVSVELSLLNQSHLAEHMDVLTAGDTHKSYVIVGDSENHILLLASFKDNHLITVFDGQIKHTVTRKHRFEHKVFAHCISSTVVGIDVQAEYSFKDLDPKLTENNAMSTELIKGTIKTTMKQANITDTFKGRKRRNTVVDISQSNEKKKRNNALLGKLNTLKESFGRTSKELQDDLNRSKDLSNSLLSEIGKTEQPTTSSGMRNVTDFEFGKSKSNFINDSAFAEDMNQECNTMDDSRINSLLDDIELEISKTAKQSKACSTYSELKNGSVKHAVYPKLSHMKPAKKADNFRFIDLLERNIDLSDDEVIEEEIKKTEFSEAIKCQIQNFLQKARLTTEKNPAVLNEVLLKASDKGYTQGSRSIGEQYTDAKHEAIPIQHKYNDLAVCLLQGQDIDIPTTIFDQENASSNNIIKNDINELEDEADFENKLTQNILQNQEQTSTDLMIQRCVHEIEAGSPDEAVYSNKELEYDRQIQDDSIIIRIHDEMKGRYLNENLENNKDSKGPKDSSVSLATCCNMSTGSNNVDIAIHNSHDAMAATGENIKEINMKEAQFSPKIPNFDSGINSSGYEEPIFQNGEGNMMVSFMNNHKTVTENCSKLKFSNEPSICEDICQNKEDHSLVPIGYENHDTIGVSSVRMECSNRMSSTLMETETEHLRNGNQYDKVTLAPCATTLRRCKNFNSLDLITLDNKRRVNTSESSTTLVKEIESETHGQSSNVQQLFKEDPGIEATCQANFIAITDRPISRNLSPLMQCYTEQNCTLKLIDRNKNHPKTESTKTNSTHHMKKYSYTKTAIDVWTKQNKKSMLQVIKKLKVDLDITEIISEETQTHEGCGVQCANSKCSNSSCTLKPKYIKGNDTSTIIKYVNDEALKREELQYSFVPKTYKNSATQNSPLIEKNCIDPTPEWIAKTETAIDAERPGEDVDKTAIENILQKYATALRKKAESSQFICSQPTSSFQTNSQQIKHKRPFKISDIHRVETKLPESLIVVNAPASPSLTSQPMNYDRNSTQQNSDVHDMPSIRYNTILEENTPEQQQLDSPDLDKTLVTIEEPQLSVTGTQDDFTIDHSMLDPKMLLQCYMNKPEEELKLIPPPPQFCDIQNNYFKCTQIDYEPSTLADSVCKKNNDDEYEVMGTPPKALETWIFDDENYESTVPMNEFTILRDTQTTSNNGYNMNSVADYKVDGYEVKGTTPKEIETWAFDQDNYESTVPKNTFTILRNTQTTSNRSHNMKSITSYKHRLAQFKIEPKKKFNVRRK